MFDIKQKTIVEAIQCLNQYNKCCIIRPTGYGKTYLAFNIASSYENIIFMYPRNFILKDVQRKYKRVLENINFIPKSYKKLSMMDDDELYEFISISNLPNTLIIMDEVHMACANKTLEKIQFFMDNCTNSDIIGLTATPDRADGLNPVVDLFEYHTVSEYTISDAIRDNVFQRPHYIQGTFELEEKLSEIKERIKDCNISDNQLEVINKNIISAGKLNIESVLNEFLHDLVEDDSYMKILIFFPTKTILKRKVREYDKIFRTLYPNHTINSLQIYSSDPDSDEITDILNLKRRQNTIDLISSIDMLTLGYHVDDITAVIMNRPTCSNIIFKQQIGRCFDVTSTLTPIIFDFVGNYFRKQYRTNAEYKSDKYNPTSLIEDTFGSIGNIIFHDKLADIETIDRLVNATEQDVWMDAVIDAYLNKHAPIEYCISKLNMTKAQFESLVSSYKETNNYN